MARISVTMAQDALVSVCKAQDCKKDSDVYVYADQALCLMQGYTPAGVYKTSTDKLFDLDKKHFPKLKKGLFASSYKDVAGYFLYCGGVRLHFHDTVTTKQGKSASYDFYLQLQCTDFDTKKFAAMLKKTKFKPDSSKTVISLSTVLQILGAAVKDAMRTILDQAPNAYTVSSSGGRSMSDILDRMETSQKREQARAKTNPMLFKFLQSKMLSIGLVCVMKI